MFYSPHYKTYSAASVLLAHLCLGIKHAHANAVITSVSFGHVTSAHKKPSAGNVFLSGGLMLKGDNSNHGDTANTATLLAWLSGYDGDTLALGMR